MYAMDVALHGPAELEYPCIEALVWKTEHNMSWLNSFPETYHSRPAIRKPGSMRPGIAKFAQSAGIPRPLVVYNQLPPLLSEDTNLPPIRHHSQIFSLAFAITQLKSKLDRPVTQLRQPTSVTAWCL